MSIIQPFPRNIIIILLVPLFDSMAVFDSRRMISMAMLMGGSLVSSVVATSHVMVSLGGSHYEHGNKVAMTQPSRSSLPPMAMSSGVDMMEPPMDSMEQPMKMPMKSMPMELMAMEPAMTMEHMDNHRVGPSVAPHLFHGGFHLHHPSRRVLAAPVVHAHHHPQAVHPNLHVPLHSPHLTTHLPTLHQPLHHHHVAPTHNCTLEIMMETTEVCTPTLTTTCVNMDLLLKKVIEKQQCEEVMRTVCSEETEVIDNEVCVYTYMPKSIQVEASTVSVSFRKECTDQMVTVCQASPGHGYHSYGHTYCKEVAQKSCYNSPTVMPMVELVTVTFPEAMMKCENRPINLPRVSCQKLTEQKCFMVPEVVEEMETVEKCEVGLGAPKCQTVELDLPKQICSEIIYGAVKP